LTHKLSVVFYFWIVYNQNYLTKTNLFIMRKLLLFLTAVFAFTYVNAQDFNDGTYNYNITTGTDCEVIGWVTLPAAPITVNIPATVMSGEITYNVVQVANGAFSAHGSKGTYRNAANANITSIVLPSSVVTVGDHALRNLPNLISVNLENVVTMGIAACNSNPALLGEFNLTSCTTLGNYAFFGCHAITKLNTPALVTIQVGAYYGMFGIREFELPASVTSIGTIFSGVVAVGDVGNFGITQFQLNWDVTELAALTVGADKFFRNITDKSGITMYIPEDVSGTAILDAYTAHPQFGLFTNIVQGTMESVLSNNKIEDSSELSVYPNPVKDILSINGEELNSAEVSIYDVTGALLLSNSISGTFSEINTSSLKPGVYLLKINTGNNEFVKQIVKE
jgi:hypothetical protein